MASKRTLELTPKRMLGDTDFESATMEELLRSGNVASAIARSFSNHLNRDLRTEPLLYLKHARLVGDIGEYSAAIHICEDIMASNTGPEDRLKSVKSAAAIWAGVYWSRLGEIETSNRLLSEYTPPIDDPYLIMLHWSHCLSNALDENDLIGAQYLLDKARKIEKKLESDEKARDELLMWEGLLSTFLSNKTRSNKTSVDSGVQKAIEFANKIGNVTTVPHLLFRAGEAYERIRNLDEALKYYAESRERALSLNSGAAFVRSSLNEIDIHLRRRKKPKGYMELVESMVIVAGQIGLGLFPSKLLRRILKVVGSQSNPNSSLLLWLVNDRYRPDLGRLIDRDFEEWTKLLLEKHQKSILGKEGYKIELKGETEPAIDLIARLKRNDDSGLEIYKDYIGIQCKGGVTPITNDSKGVKSFRKNIIHVIQKYHLDRILWISTSRITLPARESIKAEVKRILGDERKVNFILSGDLEVYLLRDVELRLDLCRKVIQSL